ncbi:serine hydrolase domain-containing protein [Alkalihalobacterium bogoriense]|uniref:serine hydrolase domain-containing protein n=1 Tax=Alkalihalobacterium bogoriense TaxID=246272 RepID=UPI00047CCFF7|nr:serine hydrolase domain-containing protein [Alkalihalobacterium bogoriense]
MESLQKLHPLLKTFVENGPAGNSLAVMHQGKTVFKDYVGFADIVTKKPISEDTIFRIYSMTKVVTCSAALLLYERGLFLLNDPLEDYLPEFKNPQVYREEQGEMVVSPATRSITIKDLFMMTSGLTYPGDGNPTERHVAKALEEMTEKQRKTSTARDLSKLLASIPLAFDPGTKWHYGFSHDVLGALIEVVSGKKLSEFFDEEIFQPLGMEDTFFKIPEHKRHRLASIYNREEDGTLTKEETMDEQFHPSATFEAGGAGLLSTLGDYSRFAHMLANGGEWNGTRIIGSKTIQLMATNHLTDIQKPSYHWDYLRGYGYGLGVRTMVDPAEGGINGSIGEFGWSGLAGTWVLIDPKEQLSAVYMQQMLPNFEAIHQPRLRAVIYGAL